MLGTSAATNRAVIRKLYKLPKVTELTKDILDVMITVIESAIEPMQEMEPSSVTSNETEKYFHVLSLISPTDQDLFDQYCENRMLNPSIKSFLSFLMKKHDLRRVTEEQKKRSTPRQALTLREILHSNNEDEQEPQIFATKEKTPYKPTCPACQGPHGVCEKFIKSNMSERRIIVDNARACSSYLRPGNFVRTCRLRKKCAKENCTRYHHPLLHDDE